MRIQQAVIGLLSWSAVLCWTSAGDGKRPGRVVVAVANFGQRSLIDDEAIAYHEGVPGHHMQLSVAQTLPDLPKFRLHGGNSGYVEGWALYAEQLAVGLTDEKVDRGTKASRYGCGQHALMRKIVLRDTRHKGNNRWSRHQFEAKAPGLDAVMLYRSIQSATSVCRASGAPPACGIARRNYNIKEEIRR